MQGVYFILKHDIIKRLRTIRPVTPYPGSPLYYHSIESGLIKDIEDFYENKHTNSDLMTVNFTKLNDDDFYDALAEANLKLSRAYNKNRDLFFEKQPVKACLCSCLKDTLRQS